MCEVLHGDGMLDRVDARALPLRDAERSWTEVQAVIDAALKAKGAK